jgi:hypothetical protein
LNPAWGFSLHTSRLYLKACRQILSSEFCLSAAFSKTARKTNRSIDENSRVARGRRECRPLCRSIFSPTGRRRSLSFRCCLRR